MEHGRISHRVFDRTARNNQQNAAFVARRHKAEERNRLYAKWAVAGLVLLPTVKWRLPGDVTSFSTGIPRPT
jgi:hypothetical protein